MNQINLYLNKCNYIKAKQLLEKELEKDPNNSDALMYLGDVYIGIYEQYNPNQQAVLYYTKANNIHAMFKLVRYYNNIKSMDQSKLWCQQAVSILNNLTIDMTNSKHCLYLGYSNLYHHKDIAKAIEYFEKSFQLGNNNPDLCVEPLMLLLELADLESSDSCSDLALFDSNKVTLWYNKLLEFEIVPDVFYYDIVSSNDSLKYLETIANKGNIKAMKILAHKFPDQAKQWYTKAADELDPEAMLKLETELEGKDNIY